MAYEDGGFWTAFGVHLGLALALVTVPIVLVVFIEPIAGGSGIPEVKAYLNGTRMPRLLRVRTLFAKALGIIFSVSSGLACGKEVRVVCTSQLSSLARIVGCPRYLLLVIVLCSLCVAQGPMIHCGAIVAAGVSQGKTSCVPCDTGALKYFRSDREKRDFVSGGSAAGALSRLFCLLFLGLFISALFFHLACLMTNIAT